MSTSNSIQTNLITIQANNILSTSMKNKDKAGQRLSSGMKINGAKDDSSAYVISERMRAQIRGLNQATSNTQNGRALLRTAESAMSSIKGIVATLKEKAIDAANGHHSEQDRVAIQSELEQMRDQIDDISSLVTFNGKSLLDGTYSLRNSADNTPEGVVLRGLNTWWISEGLDLIKDSYGLDFSTGNTKSMDVKLDYEGMTGRLAYVTSQGEPATKLSLTINMDYFANITASDTDGGGLGGLFLDRTIAHEMTHAVMASNMRLQSVPLWAAEGMAEVTHGADERVKGDLAGGRTVTDLLTTAFSNTAGNSQLYSGGYIALRYLETQCGSGTLKSMNEYLSSHRDAAGAATLYDNAIAYASGGRYGNEASFQAAIKASFLGATDQSAALKNFCHIDLNNSDTGALVGLDAGGAGMPLTDQSIIDEGGGSYGRLPSGTSSINGLDITWPSVGGGFHDGLVLQTGIRANHSMVVDIPKMNCSTLGIGELDLRTQYSAGRAINKLDKALETVTYQTSLMGIYQSRLAFTEQNLVTASENTVGSESVIRDSDMAKEMIDFTKYNILAQATQAFMVQSNQQQQGILQLLQ